jgi:hypothetical protein
VEAPRHNSDVLASNNNRRGATLILALAVLALPVHAWLAGAGDLRGRPGTLWIGHGILLAVMVAAWLLARRSAPSALRFVIVAALLFRLVAAWGEPALSDDLYRFVWDGRVQLHGIHPYAHTPDDPALTELRDDDWSRINHPELRTIYPPLAQIVFAALAALGAGPVGFKLAMGLADFGVVLLLAALLSRLRLPRDRIVWYAWNPLAILETAGSGHPEPLGVLLVVAAVLLIVRRKAAGSGAALGAAVHAKLLPLVLVPGWLRRTRTRGAVALVLVLLALWAPYALTGPPVGAGLFAYAERWEHNAFLFAGVRETLVAVDSGERLKGWIPWERVQRHVWPPELARIVVGVLLVAWIVALQRRRKLDAVQEALLTLGGALLLAPTLHPWYVLWVLPLAAATLSWGWLWLAAAVPLAYLGDGGDVPLWARLIEYVPLYALGLVAWARSRRPVC